MRRRACLFCHTGLPLMGRSPISSPCLDPVRHVVAHFNDGTEIKAISTIEQARYWLEVNWPTSGGSRDAALSKIDAAMGCLLPVSPARRAFRPVPYLRTLGTRFRQILPPGPPFRRDRCRCGRLCMAAWEHVLTIGVQPDVMAAAEPSDIEGPCIVIVMRIDPGTPADLAWLLPQTPGDDRLVDFDMRPVLGKDWRAAIAPGG